MGTKFKSFNCPFNNLYKQHSFRYSLSLVRAIEESASHSLFDFLIKLSIPIELRPFEQDALLDSYFIVALPLCFSTTLEQKNPICDKQNGGFSILK